LFFRVDIRFIPLFMQGKVEAIVANQDLEPKLVARLLDELVATPFGFCANGLEGFAALVAAHWPTPTSKRHGGWSACSRPLRLGCFDRQKRTDTAAAGLLSALSIIRA
jgi:hypothetical protein